MKRIKLILVFLILSIVGCTYRAEKLSDAELSAFMERVSPYLQELDAETDPVYIDFYNHKYSMKMEKGEPVVLIDNDEESTFLSLDNSENHELAEEMSSNAYKTLGIVQYCMRNKMYVELENDPNGVRPYDVYCYLADEGIALFPKNEQIERISICIHSEKSQKGQEGAIQIGKVFRVPKGLAVYIDWKDKTYSAYLFGDDFDYEIYVNQDTTFLTVSRGRFS